MRVDPRKGSGKLVNSGKSYFLRLAADAVRDVNRQREKYGITYARNALTRCGVALNLNGQWEERQLFPRLQEILKTYRKNFEGNTVVLQQDQEGEGTEYDNHTKSPVSLVWFTLK